ncbi:T9SS type A sorting domain-containing protein [Winogradskyella sp.]|uniref:T9SS type A sorting domain-containing protein n=1 Tax=Winogradskyella sp. TaxID=1883156 RepID=UPI003518C39C
MRGAKATLATVTAIVRDPRNLARAKSYARKFPMFFNPKALRKMDGLRTARFKKKIAQLEKEHKFAMRDVERVKSILGQATGFSNSVARQYIASLAIAGGYLANDIIQWSRDPDATVGDLAKIVGKASLFEAAIILMIPVSKIINMAAKKPVESLWNLIKNLYSKYGNAVKVAGTLATISSATAVASSSGVQKPSSIRNDNVHMLEFELGVGNNYTGYTTVPTTENNWSIISDNDYFITENDMGWSFIDDNNSISSFAHGLPDHLAYVSKKVSIGDSDNGIIAIMHKGFDAAFNYLVYQTICDIPNSTCTAPQEILNSDRDLSQDTNYGGRTTNLSGLQVPNLRTLAISTALPPDTGKVINIVPDQNSSASSPFTVSLDPSFVPVSDPVPMHIPNNTDDNFSFLLTNRTTQELSHVTLDENGNDVFHPITIDGNNDGNSDEAGAADSLVITEEEGDVIGNAFVVMFKYFEITDGRLTGSTGKSMQVYAVSPDINNTSLLMVDEINGALLDNGLPEDLNISKALFKQCGPTEGVFAFLTNYGLLVKTGVDISQLTLGDNDFEPNGRGVTLFPNPSRDVVSFSNDKVESVMVYDLNGRLVLSVSESTFSVKKLNKGVYVVKAQLHNGSSIVEKLIKN